jgi:pimeloyl-ACP methyl ester carboxylesterase
MASNSLEEEFPQEMVFINESTKEQILMSDEQEVHCFFSSKHRGNGKPILFFIRGAGPGIYSWTDLWDELYKEFDLVIVDSREKPTTALKKNKECTVRRIALDIAETIHHLKIKEEDVVFVGSSFGVFYVAHCVSQKMINPRKCLFIGSAVRASYPKFKTRLAFILPAILLEKFGKRLARNYLNNRDMEGFQKKVYLERVNSIDVRRWKRCKKMRWWNAADDYKEIACPVIIFTTADDKYHKAAAIKEVNKLIKDSKLVDVPSYNFMHIQPGVVEFGKMIKKLIEEN